MDNFRGAMWMTLAMLGFAAEDTVIKLMSGALPTWQIVMILGAGGIVVFSVLLLLQRRPLFTRAMLSPALLIRNLGELIGTIGFVSAIILIPLSTASAVLQATPLAVTLGAALFLGEPVGWRRWTAILVGFFGVLLIIRPGMEGFDIRSLLAVLAVVGLSARDLVTRSIPREITSSQLSLLAFLTLIPAGLILSALSDRPFVPLDGQLWVLTGLSVVLSVLAYSAIVAAMRVGEVSFVSPFRYSRILFALFAGMVVFGERPDALVLLGSAIIVASGIYMVWREHRLSRR